MVARLGIVAVVAFAFVVVQAQRSPAERSNGWPVTKRVERNGLVLTAWLAGGADGVVTEVAIQNRRREPVSLVADQCGRVSDAMLESTREVPEGRTWGGSIQAVKRLVLAAHKPSPEHFAPRRPGENSNAVPQCTRPRASIALAPGATVRERWARPAYDAIDAAHTQIAIEVAEANGRELRIATPTSAVVRPSGDDKDPGPSPGEQFDRLMRDPGLHAAVARQPAGSWVHASLLDLADEARFKAINRRYERAFTATLAADGRVSVHVPGPRDRARRFPTRRGTLPPGIELRGGDYRPTRDVILGSLVLPSGRVVVDSLSGVALRPRYVAPPGAHPVHVTLAGGRVALATLVVSDQRPVAWQQDRGIGIDGGTAAFTSGRAEAALQSAGPERWGRWFDKASDAIAAHDFIGTEAKVAGGTNMVLFSTGFGDGGYPLFVGLDAAGRPARYVLDFHVLRLGWRR